MLSVFDIFKVGIGPSSSHTVGPMVAARRFVDELDGLGLLDEVDHVTAHLYGSLAATGRGHGSDRALLAGLAGHDAATVDPQVLWDIWPATVASGHLDLRGRHPVAFDPTHDVHLYLRRTMPGHPNAMSFEAFRAGQSVLSRAYFSVGGGFVQSQEELGTPAADTLPEAPYQFTTAAQLLALCHDTGKSIARIMLENEASAWPDRAMGEKETMARLAGVWQVMEASVQRGLATEGILPGGLHVPRRAAGLAARLEADGVSNELSGLDWLTTYAMAVNEENAAGGRVVTAPTNGAAGVIPSVLYYLVHHEHRLQGEELERHVARFLLTAGAIGMIIKTGASLSGAEVGCQGEVGSACSMAAGGLVAYRGGSASQIENAAEIAMEHQLGLTCDPIGGLVQIPCIERNGMAACHAVSAAGAALRGDGAHLVTFDQVVATMRATGLDMRSKYRETSRGGLAVNTTLC